jgi:hypothetical protein
MRFTDMASINGKYAGFADISPTAEMKITNADESAGTLDVTFKAGDSVYENLKGAFSFYPDENRTVIWFHTPELKWRLFAKYMADGSRQFDSWEGKCNPASDDNVILYKLFLHKV